jgi:hypothetical protein
MDMQILAKDTRGRSGCTQHGIWACFTDVGVALPLELDSLNSPHTTITMAPLGEQLVDQLKSTVDKLEARVAELEARLHGKAQQVASSSSSSTSDEMRIILMGPPGAGMRDSNSLVCFVPRLTRD